MSEVGGADGPSVGDAIEKLREAMRAVGGTSDPDRRRAAATIAELARAEDADLERFTQRHLPGRAVAESTVRDLRDVVDGVARLIRLQGKQADAASLVATVRGLLFSRLDELEKRASRGEPAAASPDVPSPPKGEEARGGTSALATPRDAAPIAHANLPSYMRTSAPRAHTAAAPVVGAVAAAAPVSPSVVGPGPAAPPLPYVAPVLASSQAEPYEIVDEGTMLVDELDREPLSADDAKQAGLPFAAGGDAAQKGRVSQATANVPDSAPAAPVAAPSPVSPVDLNKTTKMSRLTAEQMAAAVRPAAVPELPPHLAMLDLESHAVFTALLHVYPQRTVEICAQYGLLDPREREQLDAFWYARFARNAHESATWVAHRDRAIARCYTPR